VAQLSTLGIIVQTPPPIFFFADLVVGQFSAGVYPSQDGEVRYEPFRGPGHLQLQTALKAASGADCYFRRDGERVAFRVAGCAKYGVLTITELSDESHDA
jgi:hypothetical protein